MDFELDQTTFDNNKAKFKSLTGLEADKNMDIFMKYMLNKSIRDLVSSIDDLVSKMNKEQEEN